MTPLFIGTPPRASHHAPITCTVMLHVIALIARHSAACPPAGARRPQVQAMAQKMEQKRADEKRRHDSLEQTYNSLIETQRRYFRLVWRRVGTGRGASLPRPNPLRRAFALYTVRRERLSDGSPWHRPFVGGFLMSLPNCLLTFLLVAFLSLRSLSLLPPFHH